jgi:hypothetical protein
VAVTFHPKIDPTAYRPLDAAAYLRARGWTLVPGGDPERYTLWHNRDARGDEYEALVPSIPSAPDLPRRIGELLDTVATQESRSPLEVWDDFSRPASDILRIRLLRGESGHALPLEDGADAFRYSRDLYLAAACAAREPRAVYGPRKAEEVNGAVRSALLGQTRPGSYVITIVARIERTSPQTTIAGEDELSLSRRAMLTLGRAAASADGFVRATASGQNLADLEPAAVAAGVSANFCEALAGLTRIGRGVELSFGWAPRFPVPATAVSRVEMSVDAAEYLVETAARFKRGAPIFGAEFSGSVQKLEKRGDDTDDVTLVGFIDGETRRTSVRCEAAGSIRHQLSEAHKNRLWVECSGDIVKEGKSYRFQSVDNIRTFGTDIV